MSYPYRSDIHFGISVTPLGGSMRFAIAAIFLGGLLTTGCASVIEGTRQDIVVHVTPSDASCSGWRSGFPVGDFDQAKGTFSASKSRHDILLICEARGYKPKSVILRSDAGHWAVIDGVLGVGPALADYVTGALNKYGESVTVTLEPFDRIERKADLNR